MNRLQSILRWLAIPALAWSCAQGAMAQTLPDFTGLVEAHGGAVVNISTTKKTPPGKARSPHEFDIPDVPEDSPLHDWLERFFKQIPRENLPERNVAQLGSGFVISPDGYILTNSHVVEGADEVIVRLSDRRELSAKVVGSDPRSDIALLKVEGSDLPAVKIGNSEVLKVGEWVVAIGSPFGYSNSVTAGIVSAKGRSLPGENYVPFIQTDVAINRGNSGGPLFNLRGEVVGVNSQILSRTGGYMGVSFAIPIELAMNVVDQLKSRGYVARGWLGVLIQDVTRELAESFGMDRPRGALVSKVFDQSPAAAAGFQPGDIVVEFDGQGVEGSASLPPMVGASEINKTVGVKIIREGKEQLLQVTVAELPEEEDLRLAQVGAPAKAVANRLGVVVADLSDEQREQLQIEEGGVIVKEVTGEAARSAGLVPGDVIVMVDNKPVADATQFQETVSQLAKERAVAVLVQRRDGPIFMALRPSEDQ